MKKSAKIIVLGCIGLAIGIIWAVYRGQNLSPRSDPWNVQNDAIKNNEILPLEGVVISPQGVHILTRIADTEDERRLGLSYFSKLSEKEGMLFVFPQMGIYPFWMKDMNFPIDIVWIDADGVVVDIVSAADPTSYPKSFIPKGSAQYVLEIGSNTAITHGFFIGGRVQIQNNK